MKREQLVIGVDYGTDSCRVIIVDAEDGNELASSVQYYPRWKKGLYCDPLRNQYRQHPLDYIETLEEAIKEALDNCPPGTNEKIIGIGFDTTGSTPALIDKNGIPLAMLPEYAENPNAMFVLWKDHTAIKEAEEINTLARQWHTDYTAYSGGIYSSEWVWAKMLHVMREDTSIRSAAYSWVEHCDWMPALLTGKTRPEQIVRSRCAAGHKAMWNENWNGLPSDEFLLALDPLFNVISDHLFTETYTSDTVVGYLTQEWAERLGLSTQVVIAVGALDCHMGAIGAGIREGAFVRVMGTSTCDVMVVSPEKLNNKLIKGICGQVDGSVIPGMVGLEAGQSAFGDIYAWFKHLIFEPLKSVITNTVSISKESKITLLSELDKAIIPQLSLQAKDIPVNDALIITDWFNGRRTPDANPLLKGTITGLTLGTTAPTLFRALVEATAFGSKAIVEHFLTQGIDIEEVIAIGGISQKSPLVMQILCDVLGVPIKVSGAQQACALGAAMFAAVAADVYSTVEEAQTAMGKAFSEEYFPHAESVEHYKEKYRKYLQLGAFNENCFK